MPIGDLIPVGGSGAILGADGHKYAAVMALSPTSYEPAFVANSPVYPAADKFGSKSVIYGDYVYATTQDASFPRVTRFDLATLQSVVSSPDITGGTVYINSVGINSHGVYVADQGTRKLYRFSHDLSVLEASSSVMPNTPRQLYVDENYVYVPVGNSLTRKYSLDLTTVVAEGPTVDCGLTQDDEYLYCSSITSSHHIAKLRKSDMTLVIDADMGSSSVRDYHGDTDANYLYFLSVFSTTPTTSHQAAKVDKATLSNVQFANELYGAQLNGIVATSELVLVGGQITNSATAGRVWAYDKGSLAKVFQTQPYSTDADNCVIMALDANDDGDIVVTGYEKIARAEYDLSAAYSSEREYQIQGYRRID